MQIVLTVSAGGVAVAAMASGPTGVWKASGPTVIVGVAVASPLPIYCILLLAGGGLGLVVVRRESHAWRRLLAGVVLIVPAALAVGSLGTLGSLPSESEAIPDIVPDEVVRSLERMLTMLTWARWLALPAVVVAAAAGVLILSGRMAPHPPAPPPSAS